MPAFAEHADRLNGVPFASALLVVAQFAFTWLLAAASWELLEKRILKFKGSGRAATTHSPLPDPTPGLSRT